MLLTSTGGIGSETNAYLDDFGLEYRLEVLKVPHTNRVHILRVDTSRGQVRPVVIVAPDPDGAGPAEAVLTNPLKLAAGRNVLAFINANPWDSLPDATGRKNRIWFEGQSVDINGLAVSAGIERSPKGRECVPIRFASQGNVYIGGENPGIQIGESVAGWTQIVKDGKVVVSPSGKPAPRTAFGITHDSSVLWLVVVDGRQSSYSEGMTWHELAVYMSGLGCWNAVNMDGGGSTVMGLADPDGQLQIVTSPSDRILNLPMIRPLPVILTIQKL